MELAGPILVVDDEEAVRKVVHTALHASGYRNLLEADNADRALEIARSNRKPIPLLLTDICLGGNIDGIQLSHLITAMRPETSVILMSGRPKQPLDLKPGWLFIAKPFSPGALVASVQESLAGAPIHAA